MLLHEDPLLVLTRTATRGVCAHVMISECVSTSLKWPTSNASPIPWGPCDCCHDRQDAFEHRPRSGRAPL